MTQIPGFIDLQVNGFRGVGFSDNTLTAETCAAACQAILSRGTAAFLPTVITSDAVTYRRNLAILAEVIEDRAFTGRVLGIHAEGPFISKQPGAINNGRFISTAAFIRSGPELKIPPQNSSASSVVVKSITASKTPSLISSSIAFPPTPLA